MYVLPLGGEERTEDAYVIIGIDLAEYTLLDLFGDVFHEQGLFDLLLSPFVVFDFLTHESPSPLGLNGDLVAKTPLRTFPPSLGGLTVGDQLSFSEKPQMSQRWVNSSIPRMASLSA